MEISQSFIFNFIINFNTGCVLNVSFWELHSFTYLFRKHKYKFTNTSTQIQVIILNKNMFAGSL